MASSSPTPWQTLLTLDQKSDDFTQLAKRLLNDQRNRKYEASQVDEEEAIELIELIEQTILQHPDISGDLKGTAFTVLRKLCSTFGRLPRSCLIREDFNTTEDIPYATRGYTDLWKQEWKGKKVAVKSLRFNHDDDKSKITKRFCKEVPLWKRLNHPNILTCFGASMSPNQFSIISPWMENDNILLYTRKYPETNRLRLLIDVASGLKYLHKMNLVHGNIRGSNILINSGKPPRAVLGDFGLNTIIFDPFSLTKFTINWTAPELLIPDDTTRQHSVSSDIYALGMVIYEVLTGTPPFSKRGKADLACRIVAEDARPQKPRDSERLGFNDEVWDILQKCWNKKASSRPQVDVISAILKRAAETWVVDVPAFLLASKAGIDQVLNLREGQAKDFANKLAQTLDEIGIGEYSGKIYLKYLQRLCGASGVLPTSFMLAEGFGDLEKRPFACGGFADVYRATYKGQPVVAKALKTTSLENVENLHKRFAKEVVGWRWLRHENILPFVGVTSTPPPFSMVSAWMENGNIMGFIKSNPDQNPFLLVACDVTNGLQYLHENDIVHGDLKGANILINSECHACLADFGLAAITGDAVSEGPATHRAGGTTRWMAPETLNPEGYGYTKRTRKRLPSKSTDIYALGMTILEVITGRKPFEHINPDPAVIQKVLGGIRPDRPTVGFSDALWKLLTQTWLEEFGFPDSIPTRPNIANILERLQVEAGVWTPASRLLSPIVPMERKPSSASSMESSRYADLIVGQTGEETFSSRAPTADLEDLLQRIDNIIQPGADDGLDGHESLTEDEETTSNTPPVGPGKEPRKEPFPSQSRTSLHLSIPTSSPPRSRPQPHRPNPRSPKFSPGKKPGRLRKALRKFKEAFLKKFMKGGQQPPRLADKIVPEQDHDVKWSELISPNAVFTRLRK